MENPTRIKHQWELRDFGRPPNKSGLWCSGCGQFVPDSELKDLVSIYEQTDCPLFIGKAGNWVVQVKKPSQQIWLDVFHCFNWRQGIEMGRNSYKGYEMRFLDAYTNSWIEI